MYTSDYLGVNHKIVSHLTLIDATFSRAPTAELHHCTRRGRSRVQLLGGCFRFDFFDFPADESQPPRSRSHGSCARQVLLIVHARGLGHTCPMAHKFYPVKVDLDALQAALLDMFRAEQFQVTVLPAYRGVTLEARKTSTIRDWTGLSAALDITAQHSEAGTSFDVEVKRVLDKVGLGVVFGALTLAGAAIPAYGFYAQHKLHDRVWQVISEHVQRAPAPAV